MTKSHRSRSSPSSPFGPFLPRESPPPTSTSNRQRIDPGRRLRSGADHLEATAALSGEQRLGDLAAGGVAGAEHEYAEGARFGHGTRGLRELRVAPRLRGKEPAGPQRDVHQPHQRRDLDQRADHRRERFSRGNAEGADGHGYGELEVVARGGERERRRLRVGEAAVVVESRNADPNMTMKYASRGSATRRTSAGAR